MSEENLEIKLDKRESVQREKIQRITFDQDFDFVVTEAREKLDLSDLKIVAVPLYQEFKIGTPIDERYKILEERGMSSFGANYYLVEYGFHSPLKVNPEIVFIKQSGSRFKTPELRYNEACIVIYFKKKAETTK